MTATQLAPAAPSPVAVVGIGRRATDLLASEWIKLWSVPSTYLALAVAAVAAPFISLSVAEANVSYLRSGLPNGPDHVDPMAISFRGVALAQLILAAVGALSITAEYGSGLVRTTFAAHPRRADVLAAKAILVAGVALVFGQVLALGCFLATQAVFVPVHIGLSLGTPGAVRAVSGAGLYLGVVSLLGLGLGAIVRHTAAAIVAVVVVFFLLPEIPSALPKPWDARIADLMPAVAAQQISSLRPDPALLTVGHAYALLAAYAVLLPVLGAIVVCRRDA